MNLADAQVKVSNTPTDRVTLELAGATITLPASDVAQLMIDKLLRATAGKPQRLAAALMIDPPNIGEAWPVEGGIYAGVVRGDEGQPDYYLIVPEFTLAPGSWNAAMEWAHGLKLHGFSDFTLPKRREQAVLFGQVPELFDKAWYWSSEEHTNAEFAWAQHFSNGYQDDSHKDSELRARAVRRVPIE